MKIIETAIVPQFTLLEEIIQQFLMFPLINCRTALPAQYFWSMSAV